jgi:hypothetical protein
VFSSLVNNLVHQSDSEEVGLTHDAHELILADLTITIAIGLLDHLLDLIVSHVFAELLCYAF